MAVPNAPTGLTATTDYKKIGLSWTASTLPAGSVVESYETYVPLNYFQITNDGNSRKFAQSFKVSNSVVVDKIGVYLGKAGAPTGNLNVRIRSTITGADLSTGTIDQTTIADGPPSAWYTSTLSSTVTLTAGVTYYIILDNANAYPQRTYWGYNPSGTYTNGTAYQWDDGVGSWGDLSPIDSTFRIYGIPIITDYKIYRSLTTGAETYYTNVGSATTTYDDLNSANINGQEYFYKVLAVNADGDSALSNEDSDIFRRCKDPTNAYADDGNYATFSATNGNISVQLSKNGGTNYHNVLTNTFTGVESTQTYGATTELWGTTFTGDDVDNTSFKLKIYCNESNNYQEYKTFGFAITASYILTGIQVNVKAKWNSGTNITSVNHITVKIYYGQSVIPVSVCSQAYATDGRKNGEGAGAGTGVLVFYDSQSKWIACDTGQQVQA